MRVRKQLITNLYVKDKDIKRLANGYVVYKRANKHAHAIIPKQKVDDRRKAEVLKAKVDYHKAQIVKLIGSSKELKDFAVVAGMVIFCSWFWWGFITIGVSYLASLYEKTIR